MSIKEKIKNIERAVRKNRNGLGDLADSIEYDGQNIQAFDFVLDTKSTAKQFRHLCSLFTHDIASALNNAYGIGGSARIIYQHDHGVDSIRVLTYNEKGRMESDYQLTEE